MILRAPDDEDLPTQPLASGQTISLTGDTSTATASGTIWLIEIYTTLSGSEATGPEQLFAVICGTVAALVRFV